jgi:hypothetical protein
MIYKGSCHCGQIAFEFEGEPTQLIECNCSICRKKGSLMWMVSPAQFRLLAQESEFATYTFNKHRVHHRFCPKCGIHTFGEGTAPNGEKMIAVNARCLDEFDLASVPVRPFDGRSL